MTDAVKRMDECISGISERCRVFYFKSENREIIQSAVYGSYELRARIAQQLKQGEEFDFAGLVRGAMCIPLIQIFKLDSTGGRIEVPQGKTPVLLYITDFQVYDDRTRAFIIKAFLDCEKLREAYLLISSPELHIPDGFGGDIELIADKYITQHDIYLKLNRKVQEEVQRRKMHSGTGEALPDALLLECAKDFVGLSERQVDTVLEQMGPLCTGLKKGVHRRFIVDEKKKEIAKDPTVSFIDVPKDESVCGVGNYISWLEERKADFENPEEAKKFGTPSPKGVLLCGVPGTGKTAAARETARRYNIPLIQFDISRIQTKSFGGSEERLRRYLERISAFGSCVMLMDEIEKVFAVNDSTHEVKRSMLSLLLDWMQRREANVFTFITANDISSLPPELLRDGRISGRFFAFMPSRDDLCEILKSKLKRLADNGLLRQDFTKLVQSERLPDGNAFAIALDRIAVRAKKKQRNLFMTGANIETLVEMTNRSMRKLCKAGGYSLEMYLKEMEKCAMSESFVPQGQSNMADIVNMWIAAQKRQYQDVSMHSILPFHDYQEGGSFQSGSAEEEKQSSKEKSCSCSDGYYDGCYDDYLREVLKERIEKVIQEQQEHKRFLRRMSE